MRNPITHFAGEYHFLSNFALCPVAFEGMVFPTLENAYQAAKTTDIRMRCRFTTITAGQAKRLGRQVEQRPHWDDLKLSIMHTLLWQKFCTPEFYKLLLKTGDAPLIEGNTWKDRYWGVYDGEGENWLGRLLMLVRSQLIASRASAGNLTQVPL